MSEYVDYGVPGVVSRDQTRTLFGQTMGYVAVTTGFFALGAYVGRNLSQGWAIVWYIVAFVCLIAMNFTVRRSAGLTVGLLLVVGALLGLAMAPAILYYADTNPQAVWQAGGATALFIAGFGAVGYATRRDLSAIARVCFFALIALIVFGIVLIFVHIPHGTLIYSILGLVIFAGPDHVRLPAAAPLQGPRLGAADRRVDLPGRAERVPVLPADLLPRQLDPRPRFSDGEHREPESRPGEPTMVAMQCPSRKQQSRGPEDDAICR